mgnify:CR=1 FL=1|tara:strand:+ start:326 stop:1318 length:993 start_codon:yes stop_codon:yes gene_type:complete
MAKFINKKEQVYDFKLTTYGRRMLSVGSLKPTYYAFYDDNVIYDSLYAGEGASEPQKDIHYRIKSETPYVESLTLFESVEDTINSKTSIVDFFNLNDMEEKKNTRKDVFRFDAAIGDAFLDGDINVAPAWKVVALQGLIISSNVKDLTNNINIPQIDIDSYYTKKIERDTFNYNPSNIRETVNKTSKFVDNRVVRLNQTEPLFYIEELNTQTLMENFEIEVFEVLSNPDGGEALKRKYFKREIPQIKNGIMLSPNKKQTAVSELTTDSVEYYFDVLVDSNVDQQLACKGAEIFNRQTYYIDFDFECEAEEEQSLFFDIYGTIVEPEICQS